MPAEPCPYCGGVNCEARFHELLGVEFLNPDYFRVHHLLVSAYMVQHEQYLPRHLETVLRDMARLMNSFPSDDDRRLVRSIFDGPTRVINRDRSPPSPPRGWTKTILDLDDSSAESYQASVRAWAADVLETGTLSARADAGRG
jgi:Family of unknown function (DUF5946)